MGGGERLQERSKGFQRALVLTGIRGSRKFPEAGLCTEKEAGFFFLSLARGGEGSGMRQRKGVNPQNTSLVHGFVQKIQRFREI